MNIGELRTFGYTSEYASQKTGTAAFAEAYALKIKEKDEKDNASSYAPEQQEAEVKQEKTESEIIVKPDGSRILVITMIQGVSKTAISMKISKPTHLPNENKTAGDQDTPTENTENVIQDNASIPI